MIESNEIYARLSSSDTDNASGWYRNCRSHYQGASLIELCAMCLSIIYDQRIPTVTDGNQPWNDIQYSDVIMIQRNTLKIFQRNGDGTSRLPMVAMTTVRGTGYCGLHIPKGQLVIMEMFPSRT